MDPAQCNVQLIFRLFKHKIIYLNSIMSNIDFIKLGYEITDTPEYLQSLVRAE